MQNDPRKIVAIAARAIDICDGADETAEIAMDAVAMLCAERGLDPEHLVARFRESHLTFCASKDCHSEAMQ